MKNFGSAVAIVLCLLLVLFVSNSKYNEAKTEVRDIGTLFFSNLSNPYSTLDPYLGEGSPVLYFLNGFGSIEYAPSSINLLVISNDTHGITISNNTEFFTVDGRILDNNVGETIFSNGTDNIIIGNNTKKLRISDGNGFPITITGQAPYNSLEISNGSDAIVINDRGWYRNTCPPPSACFTGDVIPIATGFLGSIFGNSSSSGN